MKEIVKYHNKLNEFKFPNFMEQEMNIFCNLLYHLKDKETEMMKFSASEVSNFFGSAYDNKTLAWMLKNMLNKMKEKGFEYVETEGTNINRYYITMFPTFIVRTEKNTNSIDEMDAETLKSLEVRINPDFSYLLNKLESNFTRFELAEFVALSKKYSKRLYMNLKQFRSTGKLTMKWDEFLRVMDVPENYKMCEIDQWILKPAIKELTKPRNLFDKVRIPFENLTYTKIKGKGRGRGGKVIGIEFTFKKQKFQEELEAKAKNKIDKNNKDVAISPNIKPNLNAYAGIHLHGVRTQSGNFNCKIISVFNNLENDKYIVKFKWENGEQTSQEMTKESLESLVKEFQA